MLPASRTHSPLHRRNPQINFLIVTNQRYVLKDSDLVEVYNPELDATIVIDQTRRRFNEYQSLPDVTLQRFQYTRPTKREANQSPYFILLKSDLLRDVRSDEVMVSVTV
jgi:hypothetical protein